MRWLLSRVAVAGTSMAPALAPGDRLVVLRTRRVRPGDVVVVRDPRRRDRAVVKRVTGATPDGELIVHGDNGEGSTDSRTYGPLARELLVGRVIYRYAPPQRAGALRRTGAPTRRRE
jgi:nickel-type superoxide dismutase maturation protease